MSNSETNFQTKRPASHKWAFVAYFAVAVTNVGLNLGGHFDVLGVTVTVAAIIAFFASLFLPRHSLTYKFGVIALFLVFMRSVQTLWFDIVSYRLGRFHLPAEATLPLVGFAAVAVCLLFLLLRTYTFGAASRQYYGLPITPNKRSA